MNVFLDWNFSCQELFENIVSYFEMNASIMKLPILAEVAVIFASKVDKAISKRFFAVFKPKFLDNLEYIEPAILYKTLWSLIKSETLRVAETDIDWEKVQQAITKKVKDFDNQTLIDIIVMLTVAK